MTWEAKVQLEDILSISGFPEEGLTSRVLNAEGAENGLDVGVSLLTFGLLPQRVLLHGEAGDPDPGMRPRPHPQDLRRLSFSSQDTTVPSPCFDFGEKSTNSCCSTTRCTTVSFVSFVSFVSSWTQNYSSQTHDLAATDSFVHHVVN
ncbi:unnamed protein product [Boreogadus saida]